MDNCAPVPAAPDRPSGSASGRSRRTALLAVAGVLAAATVLGRDGGIDALRGVDAPWQDRSTAFAARQA